MNDYEQKKQARIDRLTASAEKARAEANATYARATEMSEAIPFGQPIICNSTYQRQVNYRRKITRTYEKSFEQSKRAEYLEQKAEAAANNTAIYDDDPNAIQKLEAKLEKEISDYEAMKAIFKAEGKSLGYRANNANARIRTIKQRIEKLKKLQGRESKDYNIGDVKVIENVEANRIQLFFPDKPSDEMRAKLKRFGFRWSPKNSCWQGYLTATRWIKYIFNLNQ